MKRELSSPASYTRSPLHHDMATPPPSPAAYYHQQQQQQQNPQPPPPPPPQHPYHPVPVKPGPLEPLCLNIAGDYNAQQQQQQHGPAQIAYHHHQHQHHQPRHYVVPRPVPAQYPGTGYLASYAYHHQPTVTAYPMDAVARSPAPRDPSLSPPGATGSAFKPLRASPPSAAATFSPPSGWYGGRALDPWSPPSAVDVMSPPRTLSLSSLSPSASAVSPPYGLPPPPPPAVYLQTGAPMPPQQQLQQQHCNNDVAQLNRKPVIAIAPGTGGRYKCGKCAKTYSTSSGLTKHQQYHCTGGGGANDKTRGAADKTFCCKYCDKAYNTLGALKMHIRTHTLPCICNMCGKAFSRPWLLQGHIRTHTGEKPFSCMFCNRAFADRSNLRAHLQTHSDVKKYSCPTCSKTFSRMSLLTKHCDTGCPRMHPDAAACVNTPEMQQQQQQQQFKTEPVMQMILQ